MAFFNHIVSGLDDAWDQKICQTPKSRFGGYSESHILAQFARQTTLKHEFAYNLDEIKKLPTLLSYERGIDQPSRWCTLTEVREFGKNISFRYEQLSSPEIPNVMPADIGFDLDIDIESWELTTTHWAIKEADISKYIGTTMTQTSPTPISKNVFVVHGHDDAAVHEVARVISAFGLNPIVLREQPDRGQTIIEKFQHHATDASFAVVLLTPDDLGRSKTGNEANRARQNVILELGYFIGSLGRENVLSLKKGNLELPNDILGVLYTDLDSKGAWKVKLGSEMKRSGLDVDLNKLSD